MVYNGQSFKSQEVFAKAKVHYEEWNNKLALIDLGRNIRLDIFEKLSWYN